MKGRALNPARHNTRQKKYGRTWEGRTWGNGSGDGKGQVFARIQWNVSQYCNARFVIWFHGGRSCFHFHGGCNAADAPVGLCCPNHLMAELPLTPYGLGLLAQ
jgi:hypothetical protein